MKSYISDYTRHCMKFYAKYQVPRFKTEVDRNNWKACDIVLRDFTYGEREVLLDIYKMDDTLSNNITQYANRKGISEEVLWHLNRDLEYKIAKFRGLI